MYNIHKHCTVIIVLVSIDVNDLYPLGTYEYDTHVKMSTRGNCSSQPSGLSKRTLYNRKTIISALLL